MNHTLPFASDYMEGCHPNILRRLSETNHQPSAGYGLDDISDSARKRIRKACAAPQAEVKFLVGGTQTNATVIDCVLRPYEGVIAADSGHVNVHEAGAIEWGGHKVLALPSEEGKLTATAIDHYVSDFFADDNWEHMVHPGMVYISQPTEWGTLYSKKELTDISAAGTTFPSSSMEPASPTPSEAPQMTSPSKTLLASQTSSISAARNAAHSSAKPS